MTVSFNTQAALVTDTLLAFDTGSLACQNGAAYPACSSSSPVIVNGSYYGLDGNGDGIISASESIPMTPGTDGGIIIGRTQGPGDIDSAWTFRTIPGNHLTTQPVTVMNDLGTSKELDFSGWAITWNGIPVIPLGGDQVNFPDTGLAIISCDTSACANGERFTLDYEAHVPLNDPSGFGGVLYGLHLEGTISAVPVPAAVWLFSSGLLGLFAIMRRRRV